MIERGLTRLMQQNYEARLATIAEGLRRLADYVSAIDADISALERGSGVAGHRVLTGHADEEAAKFLILLDLVRIDRRDAGGWTRQLKRLQDHLARCIYVEMVDMRPADFGEVRVIVEMMRPSHYLDGPTGVDWIFPNRLLAAREERLYVDLVQNDREGRWVSPADDDVFAFGGPSTAVRDLVASLSRLGAATSEGLAVIAAKWAEHDLADDTPWGEIAATNMEVLQGFVDRGLPAASAEQADVERVIDEWGFPLGGLDLGKVKVSTEELRVRQDQVAA